MSNGAPDGGVRGQPLGVPFVVPEGLSGSPQGPGTGMGEPQDASSSAVLLIGLVDTAPRIPSCEHDPYPVPITSIAGHVVLYGFACRETGGVNPATVLLFDGQDVNGIGALPIALAPGESTSDGPWARGLHFRDGLFAQIGGTGTVAGSLYVCLRRH